MADPKSPIEQAAEGTLLVPKDQEAAPVTPFFGSKPFADLSLVHKVYQAGLASQFPDKITTFVGNRRVDLPPDQAQKALAAGTIQLPANQDLHVRLADGSYKAIPADQANQHIADGATLVSARDHHRADLAQELDTGVASGAEAVAYGVSRGLFMGGENLPGNERAEYLHGHRPGLSSAGEVGGTILQAALLPGGGLAGIAEKGAGAVVGEGILGRIASQAARASVENAQLAHIDLVNEEALGAPPVTGEKYLATIGEQALFGGLVGGAGALLGEGLGAGKKAIQGALSKGSPATDLDGVAEKAFGYRPQSGSVGDALVKAQSFLSGADAEGKEVIAKAGIQDLGREAKDLRKTILNIEEERAGAVKSLSEDMDGLLTKTESIADESRGISKRNHLKGLVESPLEAPEVQAHAMDSLQDVRNQVAEMAADADTFGNGGALKRIDQQLRGHEKDLVSAVEKGDQAEMFAVLDDTKRTIGNWSRKFQASARAGDPLAREQAQEVFTKLGDVERGGGIYQTLRQNLEDESTWGKAATSQKAINAAWTDYIAASKQLGRAASVTSQVGENNFGRAIYGVDPAKMERYVAGLVNPNNDVAHKAMTDYIRSAKTLASTIDDSFELAADKQAMVKAVKASAAKMETNLATVGDKIALSNQTKALIDASKGGYGALYGHMVGGAVGGVAGGLMGDDDKKSGAMVGGLVGAALGGLGNPGKNIMRLAQLESAVSKFDGRVGGALKRFFARGESSAASAVKAGKGLSRGAQTAERENVREEFTRRVKTLKELRDPMVLQNRMAGHFEALQGSAPQTAASVGATAAKAVGYLLSRMPTADDADPLTGKPGVPPLSAMSTFLVEARAVERPETVVDDLARGRITVEQVDALKNVYPGIYQELQGKVQQSIADHVNAGKPLSFQKRISLGVLMDVETDPSLAKPSMSHATATFATQPEPAQKAGGGGGGKGPSPRGNALKTPDQQMSSEPGVL